MSALEIKEWLWEKPKASERKEATFPCPYCNVTVQTQAHTRIIDATLGSIKYHIYKCPHCSMPVTIGQHGEIIPPKMFLPFQDIPYLPKTIENMFAECRKSFSNECFYSVIMVARSLIMRVAIDKGAEPHLRFISYVDYLENNGYISPHNRAWVDKVRVLGNHFIHDVDNATSDDANNAIVFISQLLKNIYEMPHLAQE
jgi:endogenous inhibitor of DNA gyrase (YacG/DUF329 family)